MGRIALEPYNPAKHRNHMPEICQTILPHGQVIVVEEGKFRLEFLSIKQLEAAIAFFEKKDGGSTRVDSRSGDHWEFQSWQSKLPAGMLNKHRRGKMLALLRVALDLHGSNSGYADACV